ncbi:secretory lipase [Exophiala viscosa]|uniref:Secretory lipase n=1 Tax=Exophiala viscosa TaxID=2486360 RepID=A0AAN6DS48_9EURO|nr:secretory lipase [Exophiala viscosa]
MVFPALASFWLLPLLSLCQAQAPVAQSQNTTFNATYGHLNSSQAESLIAQANLSAEFSVAILTAVNFERSNWAGSSTQLDPFYVDVPSNDSHAPAGSVIKVEQYTNTSFYTVAPNVALSRMLFMTKTLNGTTIPASAYVLWPWLPRRFANVSGLPVVAWGHGTSGWSGECGPSHIRNLWYQYSAPFILALQGYVVVAPDYAGLGLDHDSNGTFIPHQYLASPAAGNDLIYSVQAAQQAWPSLSKKFVIMGHSQGGGAAWGAAQILAENPVQGYLGTIAGSPTTSILPHNISTLNNGATLGSLLVRVGTGVSSVFPSFQLSDWLNDIGVRSAQLLQGLQGCQSVALELLSQTELVQQGWNTSSWYFDALNNLTTNGGKPFAGPMLVLQGTADPSVDPNGTTAAVNATCQAYPDRSLEYATFEGVTHVPVLYAGQQVWLDWIADRFSGVNVSSGCHTTHYQPQLAVSAYQSQVALFLQYPLFGYETA